MLASSFRSIWLMMVFVYLRLVYSTQSLCPPPGYCQGWDYIQLWIASLDLAVAF